jgi:hypothetical protein
MARRYARQITPASPPRMNSLTPGIDPDGVSAVFSLESRTLCRAVGPAKRCPRRSCCSSTSRVSQHTTSWEELKWQLEP